MVGGALKKVAIKLRPLHFTKLCVVIHYVCDYGFKLLIVVIASRAAKIVIHINLDEAVFAY